MPKFNRTFVYRPPTDCTLKTLPLSANCALPVAQRRREQIHTNVGAFNPEEVINVPRSPGGRLILIDFWASVQVSRLGWHTLKTSFITEHPYKVGVIIRAIPAPWDVC